jgi:aminomethyltransferase
VTDEYAALALQGPTSRALLQELCDADLAGLRYFRLVETRVAGVPAQVSRTGYTGDLGYEIFVAPQEAEELWDSLLHAGRAHDLRPAGNVALDMLRVEAGLLLIDADFKSASQTFFEVQKSTPYELGLDWVVKLDKPYFVGQPALRREKETGAAWATVGLAVDIGALEKAFGRLEMPLHLPYHSWNEMRPIYADGERRQHVGKTTSGTWSPVLKKYVVIARVRPQHGKPGNSVYMEETVEGERFAIPATVVPMPFFDPPRKKE